MDWNLIRLVIGGLVLLLFFGHQPVIRWYRKRLYTRGRDQVETKEKLKRKRSSTGVRFGNSFLPEHALTSHFLVVGTTGSGKSQIQKLLMKDCLRSIRPGSDRRAIIFDAKNDMAAFMSHIGLDIPVLSLNPFEARSVAPVSCRWDIAQDITSPARAINLASSLIRSEKGGQNQYFTDAARQVLVGVIESLMKHSPGVWTFSDLVFASLSQERISELLSRDEAGRDTLAGFFGDDRTAYQVFTTICSKMSYYKPVAALWQNSQKAISIRQWLVSESVLLLGANATAKTSLDAINEQIFRVFVEEVDVAPNCSKRKSFCWIDEARLAGPLLRNESLTTLAVKGRSKGAVLVLAFQDIEGLQEAAGERIANEIVANLGNKALLRMESDRSASWASKQLGQFETIEYFSSDSLSSWHRSLQGQRVVKDAVLASEFQQIPPTNPTNGLTGYFLSPEFGAYRGTIPADDIRPVVVPEHYEREHGFQSRLESEQWLANWTPKDRNRLALEVAEVLTLKTIRNRGKRVANRELRGEVS